MNLTDILAAVADITDPDARVARIDELLSSGDVDLAALEEELSNRAADLTSIDPSDMTDEQIAEAELVAQLLVMVGERIDATASAAASAVLTDSEPATDTAPVDTTDTATEPATDTAEPTAPVDTDTATDTADAPTVDADAPAVEPDTDDTSTDTTTEPTADTGSDTPEPATEPVDVPTADDTTADNDTVARAQAAIDALNNATNTDTETQEPTLEPVPASGAAPDGGRRSAVPLNKITTDTEPAPDKWRNHRVGYSVIAAGDLPGYHPGQTLDNMAAIAEAVTNGMTNVSRSQVPGQRQGLVSIKRDAPDHLRYTGEADWRNIDAVTDQRNLPEKSLVAAGGWCAPSEFMYDTCPITVSSDGMVDLPTITARRGGIKFSGKPDFSQFWQNSGFIMSETDMIAGLKKPCIEIPCPDDLLECRMDVAGICLRQPILVEQGWPEKVEEFVQYTMLAHAHKMNAVRIRRMVDLATHAITVDAPAPPQDAAIFDPHGPGAFESLLSVLELQVEFFRYSGRLARNATLEAIAPFWLRGLLRADISKKLGIDNRWGAGSDAALDQWFRDRGVRITWVYDWQDAMADQDDASFGGTVPTQWPTEVQILLYEPGTYFALQQDVIQLSGVYDSAGLERNLYTRLFTEEGFQVCSRCGRSMLLTIGLCPNGLSGTHQRTTCDVTEDDAALVG